MTDTLVDLVQVTSWLLMLDMGWVKVTGRHYHEWVLEHLGELA